MYRFTIHELGHYDLTAALKKCYAITNKKICYIGHSMGTTSFLAMCSNNKDVVDLVALTVLLAPVVVPATMKSPIKLLAPAYRYIAQGCNRLGFTEFVPNWTMLRRLITAPWLQALYAVVM